MTIRKYSDLDREIIVISAVWDLIGSMVHYGHFVKEHKLEDAVLMFKTEECGRLFIILLADFLSIPSKGTFGLTYKSGTGSLSKTYLGNLFDITEAPHFTGQVSSLQTAVQTFAGWLDGEVTVKKVWLPSIERDGDLTVRRMTYLKICGTASKHGFTRLGNTVRDIQKIMSDNGTEIDVGQSYIVIPEFQEWFRDHVFAASASMIAWHLNEVRWGLYHYLRPEQERACKRYRVGDFDTYRYDVPPPITNPLVRSMYWELMNNMMRAPYFPRFTVQSYLREEF